jgi:zinc/manganese transport system substrate-binding protein
MHLRTMRCATVLVVGLVAAWTLVGCGQSAASSAAGGSSTVEVVASTNVWGAIVGAVGGSKVHVTSVITDPSADPHSYEANARTQLAVSRASVVVLNGGGYDDFMTRLLSASRSKATVINAVDVSGQAAAARATGAELNEHVWYDFPSVGKVTDRIVSALTTADPGDAGAFRANGKKFVVQLNALTARELADSARTHGAGVAITEPVPLYMLQALGAVNRTPPAFSYAVENGDDVSPAVLQQTTALFTSGAVKALVYNEQTASAQTSAVQRAATAADVAVVPVTETLPGGETYLSWMTRNLDAIAKALTS